MTKKFTVDLEAEFDKYWDDDNNKSEIDRIIHPNNSDRFNAYIDSGRIGFNIAIKLLKPYILKQDEGLGFYDKKMSVSNNIERCNRDYCIDHGDKSRTTRAETKALIDWLKEKGG